MNLSIIIPNYNGEKTIKKCIESIYAQNVEIEEIIVVDDASIDDSVRLIRENYPEVKIIEHNKNYGAAKARNNGIKNSIGDLLLFVDNDVYISDTCVRELIKYIDRFDIVYPKVAFETGEILSPASENEKRYIRRSAVFLIKKNVLRKIDELFDENYQIYYEDVDFFTRCYLAGLKSKYVDTAMAYHSVVETSNRNLEKRYYLETKNKIYFMIKLLNAPKSARKLFFVPNLKTILSAVHIALSNKNIYSNYPDHADKDKLSNSRFRLISILFKAILWNISNLRKTLKKGLLYKK